MKKEIEKIIVDILTHEMDLPENYGTNSNGDVIPCVVVYGQNIKLFNTDKLQITVKTVTARTYSNRTNFVENPNSEDGQSQFLEVQDINQSRLLQVDIYSKNNEARERFWEVTAALKSVYSEQQQDLYNFKLGTISDTENTSGLEGGSDINRFTLRFNALLHYQKTKPVDYYDKFNREVVEG